MRKELEERERLEQERVESENQMAEVKRQAEKDRRSKLIAYGLAIAAVFGLAFSTWQYFKARDANRNVVYMLMREADKSILSLDYDGALEKCQTALELGVARDSIGQRLQEVAYFYTETDTFKAVLPVLNLLNVKSDTNRMALRTVIKGISPSNFENLEHRYYPEVVQIEGGSFKMDSTYVVKINSFKMAKTETTVWQYNLFVKATKHIEPRVPSWQWSGDNPIVYVSWFDAVTYNNWLSEKHNLKKVYVEKMESGSSNSISINYDVKGYRLPTEAEWEFAARGGNKTHGFEFSGDSILGNISWYYENSKNRTQAVGRKTANELGLFDLTGNVKEWCNDWFGTYNFKQIDNPHGAKEGNIRVIRGGSWSSSDNYCRVSYRNYNNPNFIINYVGFRCVRYD